MNVALLAEKQATMPPPRREQRGAILFHRRLGYALVLESQNLRQGLQKQTVIPAQASQTLARYGLRLWNPQVSEPGAAGNPFAAYAADASAPPSRFPEQRLGDAVEHAVGPGARIKGWLATSAETETLKIDLPALGQPLAQPLDPALLQSLTRPAAG